MNIFYLDSDPKTCAEMHCDKHVVKMIIEYAQLMSTAHRILDGQEYVSLTSSGRKIRRWQHPLLESSLMKASHVNHPSAIWTRASKENYRWLYDMWICLLEEYTHRYGRRHACEQYREVLYRCPSTISGKPFTSPTPAMPDECKVLGDSLSSYKKFYVEKKARFARWTNRQVPIWFIQGLIDG